LRGHEASAASHNYTIETAPTVTKSTVVLYVPCAVMLGGGAANRQFCVLQTVLFAVQSELKLVYCLYAVHVVNTAASRFDSGPVLLGLSWPSGIRTAVKLTKWH
jgi:hypothetical protein